MLDAARDRGAVDAPAPRSPRRSPSADAAVVAAPRRRAAARRSTRSSRRRRPTASSPTSARPSARSSPPSTTSASSAATRWPAPRPAGVEHARADLFDGATWYLTPTERDVRACSTSACTARRRRSARSPRRSTPTTHDRAAGRGLAPAARARQRARRPGRRGPARRRRAPAATGPSFRDATRVAGANPAHLGRHLPVQPRRAGRARSTPPSARLDEVRDALRAGDRDGVERLERPRRAPSAATRCSRPALRRRPGARAARLRAQPARRGGRARAGARPRRRQHRRHGALPRRRHDRAARSRCGSPATARPTAPRRSSARSASRWRGRDHGPLRPGERGCAASSRPPPDKSISHRAALLGAMGDEPGRGSRNYLDAGGHRLDARRGARARRAGRGAPGRARRSAAPACARRARPTAPIDVGNAGTLMRLLPGLAGRAGRAARGRSTATRRSAAGRSTASPSRCERMGAQLEAHRRALPAVHRPRRAPARRSTTTCRWPARRSSRACCSPALRPTARRRVTEPAPTPRPHRAHARARRRADPARRPRT